jgi:hypothetical protein
MIFHQLCLKMPDCIFLELYALQSRQCKPSKMFSYYSLLPIWNYTDFNNNPAKIVGVQVGAAPPWQSVDRQGIPQLRTP